MAKKSLLKDLIINRIDLVPEGDNPMAHIMMYKRREGGDITENTRKSTWWMDIQTYFNLKGEDLMTLKEILGKLSDGEAQFLNKALEDKDAELNAVKEALKSKESELETVKTDLEKAQSDVEVAKAATEQKVTEDIWKGANPELKKAYDELAEQQKQASEALKKMQYDTKKEKFSARVATLKALSTPENFSETLIKVEESVGGDAFNELFTVLEAANKAIDEGALLKEAGKSGGGAPTGAMAKIEKLAKEIVSAEGITMEAAVAKVADTHPELYKQHREESEV